MTTVDERRRPDEREINPTGSPYPRLIDGLSVATPRARREAVAVIFFPRLVLHHATIQCNLREYISRNYSGPTTVILRGGE